LEKIAMTAYSDAVVQILNAATLDEIRSIATQFSAKASGSGGILYSGDIANTYSGNLALQLAEKTGLSIINRTARGGFLSDGAVEDAIKARAQSIFVSKGYSGDTAKKLAGDFLFGDGEALAASDTSLRNSLWGQASQEFAASLRGDITVVAESAKLDRVFAQVELPAVFNESGVTLINGKSLDLDGGLRSLGEVDRFTAVQTAFRDSIVDGGLLKVTAADGTASFEFTKRFAEQLGIDAAPFESASDILASLKPGAVASSILRDMSGFALKGLKILGPAALFLDIATSSAKAAQQFNAGKNGKADAAQTMADLAARLYFGLQGAAWGARIGGIPGALIGGVGGALLGEKGVDSIWDSARALIDYLTGASAAANPPMTTSSQGTGTVTVGNLVGVDPRGNVGVVLGDRAMQTLADQLRQVGVSQSDIDKFASLVSDRLSQERQTDPSASVSSVVDKVRSEAAAAQSMDPASLPRFALAAGEAILTDAKGGTRSVTLIRADGKKETTQRFESGEVITTTFDGNGAVQKSITTDTSGNVTSILERRSDGETLQTFYSGGRATDSIVVDAYGYTQTITYGASGSQHVTVYDENGNASVIQEINAGGNLVTQIGLNADGTEAWRQDIGAEDSEASFSTNGRKITLSDLSSTLGSAVGTFLGGNSLAGQIGAATALGTIAGKFGELIERSAGFGSNGASLGLDGLSVFDHAFADTVKLDVDGNVSTIGWGGDAIASGLSSLLIGEAAQALGLKGFGAAAFNTVGTAFTTQILKNAYNVISVGGDLSASTASGLFAGLGGDKFITSLETQIGGALGSYIGALIVPAVSQGGAIGGSVASAVGSLIGGSSLVTGAVSGGLSAVGLGAEVGTALAGPIGTFVGALVGEIVGTLVGNLIDPKKTPVGTSIVGAVNGIIAPTTFWAWDGGNVQTFYKAAFGVSNMANALIGTTGAQVTGLGGTGQSTFQMVGQNFVATTVDGVADWFSAYGDAGADWTRAVNESALSLVKDANLTGGDPIMIAALAAASRQDIGAPAIAADLQIAADYKTYLANADIINAAIVANPNSVFAAGWIATLARAQELGLNSVGDQEGWKADLIVNGAGVAYEIVRDANGVVQEEAYFNPDGTQQHYQYYLNETVSADFVQITVPDGATLTLDGVGDDVAADNGATITISGDYTSTTATGNGNTITLSGAHDSVSVSGSNNTVIASAGSDITVAGGVPVTHSDKAWGQVNSYGFWLPVGVGSSWTSSGVNTIRPNQSSITVADGAIVNLIGWGNTIRLGAGDSLSVSGGGNTINSGAGNVVSISNTNGNFDTVNANGLQLGGKTADGQNTGIWLNNNAQANVYGSNNGIALGAGDSLGVSGGGNTINSGAGNLVWISGTNGNFDTVNASGDQFGATTANGQGTGIYLDNNAQANVYGSNNGINLGTGDSLGAYGGGNTINSGDKDRVWISGTNGNFDTVNANGDKFGATTANGQGAGIYLDNNVQANVYGSNNGIALGTGDRLGVYGGGNTINSGAGNVVWISNTNGNFDTVNANGLQLGGKTADGQNTGIWLNNNAQANVLGGNNGINLGSNDQLGLYGDSNTVNGGNSNTITVSGQYDVVNVSNSSYVSINGNADVVNAGAGSTVNATGGVIQTIITGWLNYNGALVPIYGTQDLSNIVNVSDGNVNVGEKSTVRINGSSDTITVGGSSAVTVAGGSNTINSKADDRVWISGTNSNFDTVNANGDQFGSATASGQATGIYLDDNAQANIFGVNNGIALGTGNSLGVYGGGNTINSGAGNLVWISGTNGNFDTVNANGLQLGGKTANGQSTGVWLNNNAQANVVGSNNGINLGSYDQLGVYGDSNTVNGGNSATITVSGH
jgi:hypothetical protein